MKNCNEQVTGFERSEIRMSEDQRADIFGKAKTNRKRVKDGLNANGDPKSIGMRTQGSYSMRTMIQYSDGDYDIDDGSYFKREDLKGTEGADKSALETRNMVCKAAKDDRFKDQPEVRKNCVRVYYNEGYHVDVPVYRETETKDPSTGNVNTYQEIASSEWKKSDPLSVTKWFAERNATQSDDATKNGNDGQFVRNVRLMKAFARSRKSWAGKIASGFAISRLSSDQFMKQPERDDVAFRELMKSISNRLTHNSAVRHPTLEENIAEAGDPKISFFKSMLDENLEHLKVLDDANCTHADAMNAWDMVFNTDWFTKQPDPEGELEVKMMGPAVIKKGETRYAKHRYPLIDLLSPCHAKLQ